MQSFNRVMLAVSVASAVASHPVKHTLNKRATTCPTTTAGMVNSLSIASTSVLISATGCPPYDWTGQTTPNTAGYQNYAWKIVWPPVLSTTKTYIGIYAANNSTNSNPVMGTVGLSVDGVAIYGNADANRRDAYIYEGSSFDSVGGHADMSSR
eukprot:jgi/Hompol1/2083/HPOL_005083-RA